MILGGLQKTTLVDFPGRVACTVFTVGCNFRCPFCHNKDLVTQRLFKKSGIKPILEDYFFDFLEKRRKILDGVCITGGEPTIWKDLPNFCQKIKDLGLEVKLDSNGSNPNVLKNLIDKKLIDFIAMDVKTAFKEYSKAVNVKTRISNIKSSIKLISQSGLEYEFRTTVVPGIHDEKAMVNLAKDLKKISKKCRIYIQSFRPKNCLNPEYLKIKPYNDNQIKKILLAVQKVLPKAELRDSYE